ncbi:MAG TPA: hypothetical protein VF271_06750, partial [Rhodanobacteraceae bacterium]
RRGLRLAAVVLAGGCGYLLARGTGSVGLVIGGVIGALILASAVFCLSWRWRWQLLLLLVELLLPLFLMAWWKHDWHLVYMTSGMLAPFAFAGLLLWIALRVKDKQDHKP